MFFITGKAFWRKQSSSIWNLWRCWSTLTWAKLGLGKTWEKTREECFRTHKWTAGGTLDVIPEGRTYNGFSRHENANSFKQWILELVHFVKVLFLRLHGLHRISAHESKFNWFFVLSFNSSHLKIFQWLNVEYKTFTNAQNLNKAINQ